MSKSTWILLADDDPEDIELLEQAILLLAPAARVKTFPDGKAVMQYLTNHSSADLPCTIVLDYNMPFLNGPQVLDQICSNPVFASIPKLIWSTSGQPEHISTCINKGATDYMVKPNNPSGITLLAKKIVGHCLSGR